MCASNGVRESEREKIKIKYGTWILMVKPTDLTDVAFT